MLLSKIPSYYKTRRDALIQNHPDSVFIFPAYPELIRNSDVHYPYRQESNFYYLSGFDEPGSFLVISSSGGKSKMTLFVQPRDPEKEMWEGERYGVEGALQVFGADEAYLIDEFESLIPSLLKNADRVYYRMGLFESIDRKVLQILEITRRSMGRSGKGLLPVEDPQLPVGEIRLYKSAEELELLRKACQITSLAHRTAMMEARPGMNEYEVEALVDYVFRKNGCQRVGYGSIVAAGKNATCLHYRSNNDFLQDQSLLLIDAGGEFGYYTSDITRTFPIGRKFTPAQAQAYQLVLRAQKAGIEASRPGAKLPDIHRLTCEIMIDGLLSLGLLTGNPKEILKTGGYRRFYPHNTSHWLGMDVHDAGLYLHGGEPRSLEPGMVFTIEPGFYVQPNDLQAPAEFRNIGIRIEDDILITPQGCEVLTHEAPKEIQEIESIRAQALREPSR